MERQYPHPTYKGLSATRSGRVFSSVRGLELGKKPGAVGGYTQVRVAALGGKKKYKHVLVFECCSGEMVPEFDIRDPNRMEVNHKDGDKTNDSYRNLELITHAENVEHSMQVLGNGYKDGCESELATLAYRDVVRVIKLWNKGKQKKEIAERIGTTADIVNGILLGKTYQPEVKRACKEHSMTIRPKRANTYPVERIRKAYASGSYSMQAVANRYDTPLTTVHAILHRKGKYQ